MPRIYLKLAWRNVRRSVADYVVYFLTLAFAACLLYSFTASGDYLLSMDLSPEQRGVYESASMVVQAFSVFSVVVFAFLVVYANRFILRRRSLELAMYGLLGMDSMQTSRVLLYENVFVGALSLAIGLAAGIALSPAFGGLASFVFGVPWRFGFAFSENAALWDCGCFAAIMAVAMLAGMRGIRKRSLLQLMNANRVPEKPKGAGSAAMRVQAVLALQQLAEGADSVHRYRILDKMGCDSSMMRRAVWAQTGAYFAAPLAFALVHCVFGLALVGFLAAALGSSSFAAIVAGTVGGTVAFLGVYYLVTSLVCERMLLGSVCHWVNAT